MSDDVTHLLLAWCDGSQQALDELMPLIYDELHRLAARTMRRERSDHTLQPTALVNEAYLRLIDQRRVRWRNRAHFIGVAAQLMRRVMVKHAERLRTAKRGGGVRPVVFEEALAPDKATEAHILALDEALVRLQKLDQRQGQIVELRYFGGLSGQEIADFLDISRRTVDREWRLARTWLKRELTG